MKKNLLLPLVLMLVFALSRWPGLMPGNNFSAAYALVFCAGLYFPGLTGWALPLGTLFLSDILISMFGYPSVPFSWGEFFIKMGPNYLAYAALVLLGRGLGRKRSFFTLVCGGVVGAFIFYIVTNVFSWLTTPEYSKTLQGLIQALTVGLPNFPHTWTFFLRTLLSGGLFSGFFIGAIKLLEPAESAEEKREPEPEVEPEPEEAKS